MTLKVRCEQCGKVSQFAASDAGMTALCVACGARFTIPKGDPSDSLVPQEAIKDAGPEDSLSEFVPAQTIAVPAGAAAAARDPGGTKPQAAEATPPSLAGAGRARRGMNYALLYTLLGSAMTVAIIFAAVVVFSRRATWEDQHRVALRDLKSRAEAFVVDRKLQQAYDTYRQIDEMVAGHDVEDPKLKVELERARADRDELFKVLFAKVKSDQSAAVATRVTTTSAKAPPPVVVTVPAATTVPARAAGVAIAAGPATTATTATTGPTTMPTAETWPEYRPTRITTRPAGVTLATTEPARVAMHTSPPASQPVSMSATTRPAADSGNRPRLNVQRAPDLPQAGVTDEEIGQAIQRSVNYLIPRFQNGQLQTGGMRNDTYVTGLDALCVYALLQSSYAIKDERLNPKGPFIRELVERMKKMPADNGPATYARGIRATALALLARPEDKAALSKDVTYLLGSHISGAYTYSANRGGLTGGGRMGPFGWDNSNSQYGLLGVWSAAEIGAEVNSTYWQAVENHWSRCQLEDGSWDYTGYNRQGGNGRISMSVAGVASLFVTHDYLDAPRIGGQVGRPPFSKALSKGLAYLEFGDNAINVNGGYSLYGLERAGLASGFKYFGDHDWYRELAGAVVRAQDTDGSWGGSEVETAYHLLFLARGKHPVLMNKLRYEGSWANRPRDVSNLARFGTRELERPLNWQVVPITRDWTDWTDSPILAIGTHTPVKFTDDEVGKIRNFVEAGGLLFTQADGGKSEADQWAQELAKKLFPLYEMRDLPDDHDLYSILYKPSPHPVLRGVSNGARLLMVHSPTDITQYWQMRQDKTRRSLFELGINLYLYASGKGDLRNRLTSTFIPPQGPATGGTIGVTRIKYPGNWDPEPVAWGRFGRYFQHETSVGLNVRAVDLENLGRQEATFAHWTGTHTYTPTDAGVAAIRRFVENGGVLLIEPCGGSGEFYESARQTLSRAFPEARGEMLPKAHPMLTSSGPGMDDLSTPQVRKYVKAKGLGTSGRLDVLRFGKGRVIYNTLDMTSGLLGTNTWGILGFEPNYSAALLKNMLLWSATGMKDE